MTKGRRLVLLVTSLVLCASAAFLLSVTTPATFARSGTASSRHAVRGDAPVVLAGVALPGGATEARASGQVRLVLQQEPLTTAEAVPVTVINGSASAIYRSLCFVLERPYLARMAGDQAQSWRSCGPHDLGWGGAGCALAAARAA